MMTWDQIHIQNRSPAPYSTSINLSFITILPLVSCFVLWNMKARCSAAKDLNQFVEDILY